MAKSLTSRGCGDTSLCSVVMRAGRRRSTDRAFEYGIKVSGKGVASWVDVYGGVEGLDVNRLLDAPPDPITFTRQDGNVFLSEMVFIVARMLEHGGFEFALRIDGGGGVLLKSSLSSALCFPHICAWAWDVVSASARYVIDKAVGLLLF